MSDGPTIPMSSALPVDEPSAETLIRFTYQPPTAEQAGRMGRIRELCLDLAAELERQTPASREQALAMTALEQVSMYANAAIARREPRP